MAMRLLLPLLLLCTICHAQTNLAPNPGFEESGGWDLVPVAGAEGTIAPDAL